MLLEGLNGTRFCSQRCWSLGEVSAVLFNRFVLRCLWSGESETSSLPFPLSVLLLKLSCRLSRFYLCCTEFNPKIRICLSWSLQIVQLRPSDNLWWILFAGPNPYLQSRREEFSNIHVKAHVCAKKPKTEKGPFFKTLCPKGQSPAGKNIDSKFGTLVCWVWVPVFGGNQHFGRDSSPGLPTSAVAKACF